MSNCGTESHGSLGDSRVAKVGSDLQGPGCHGFIKVVIRFLFLEKAYPGRDRREHGKLNTVF